MLSELFIYCLFDYSGQINNAHFNGPNTFKFIPFKYSDLLF